MKNILIIATSKKDFLEKLEIELARRESDELEVQGDIQAEREAEDKEY